MLLAIASTIYRHGDQSEYPMATYQKIAMIYDIRYLGHGCERVAFLLPDGTVGKFTRNPSYTNQQEAEIENWRRCKEAMVSDPDRFVGWGVPDMELIYTPVAPVIVAEYIEADTDGVSGFTNPWNARDAHYDNIRQRDGVRYIIDLGFAF